MNPAATIGAASEQTGIPAKTIRYYESIGLLPAAVRSRSGYRLYTENDIRILQFVHRARDLGFPLSDIADLLALWRDRARSSAEVKRLAKKHVADIDDKIKRLAAMRDTVADLAARCRGDHRPDCPILDDLSGAR